MPNALVAAAAEGLPKMLPSLSRRGFMNTAAVAAAASLPGCSAMAPAVASIRKAAPYIPAPEPDAELLRLASRFSDACTEHAVTWQKYCRLPVDAPEAHALAMRLEGDIYDAWVESSDACYALTPTTPTGAAALLGVVLAREDEAIEARARKPLRALRDALAGMVQS